MDRKEINRLNRQRGKQTEREVAKRTGGFRVPGSGAIKNSVKNLEGDVRVMSEDGTREFLVIECKTTAQLTKKGERVFTVKRKVVDQMVTEANLVRAVGALFIHWQHNSFDDDYVLFEDRHWWMLDDLTGGIYSSRPCSSDACIEPKGNVSFTFSKAWADAEMRKVEPGVIGFIQLNWRDDTLMDTYTNYKIIRSDDFFRLVDEAKKGANRD